jgi:uncharacterized membrane protein YfcA
VIGFLGGVVGLILGSLRMPALLRLRRRGTGASGRHQPARRRLRRRGRGRRARSGRIDWVAFAIGAAASVPGALLGARLTGRLDERQLLRAIGIVLLFAGAITLLQAAV